MWFLLFILTYLSILSTQKIAHIYYTSQIYSKSRNNEETKWADDSSIKHDIANDAIHRASNNFLATSYLELEDLQEH